jgi:pyruvate kinase
LPGQEAVIDVAGAVADRTERSCLVMADLPGPKIRIDKLMNEPLLLEKGNEVILTIQNIVVTADQIPVEYKRLPESVNPGKVPEAAFMLDTATATAREYCNPHGLWKA